MSSFHHNPYQQLPLLRLSMTPPPPPAPLRLPAPPASTPWPQHRRETTVISPLIASTVTTSVSSRAPPQATAQATKQSRNHSVSLHPSPLMTATAGVAAASVQLISARNVSPGSPAATAPPPPPNPGTSASYIPSSREVSMLVDSCETSWSLGGGGVRPDTCSFSPGRLPQPPIAAAASASTLMLSTTVAPVMDGSTSSSSVNMSGSFRSVPPATTPTALAAPTTTTTATTTASSNDSATTTLFLDALPGGIENPRQLSPYVPPMGLVTLRVKRSHGRDVGFAVYDGVDAACAALQWFENLQMLKEMVSTCMAASSSGAGGGALTNKLGDPNALPISYEEFLATHRYPDRYALQLQRCRCLRAEWSHTYEAFHPPVAATHQVRAPVAPVPSFQPIPSAAPGMPGPLTYPQWPTTPPTNNTNTFVGGPLPKEEWSYGWHSSAPTMSASTWGSTSTGPTMMSSLDNLSGRVGPTPAHFRSPPSTVLVSAGVVQRPPMGEPLRRALPLTSLSPPQPPTTTMTMTMNTTATAAAAYFPDHHGVTVTPLALAPSRERPLIFSTSMPPSPQRPAMPLPASAAHPIPVPPLPRSGGGPYEHLTRVPSTSAFRADTRKEMAPPLPPPPAPTTWSVCARKDKDPQKLQEKKKLEQKPRVSQGVRYVPCRTLFVKLLHAFASPQEAAREMAREAATAAAAAVEERSSSRPPSLMSTPLSHPPSARAGASSCEPSFEVTPVAGGEVGSPAASLSAPYAPLCGMPRHASSTASDITLTNTMTTPCSPFSVPSAVAVPPAFSQESSTLPAGVSAFVLGCSGAAPCVVPQLSGTSTEEDRAFFALAHHVLREAFFTERFVGVVNFRPYLHPPYYGGCFVLFERDLDMHRCLQRMRDDRLLMQLFSMQPARSDTFDS